VSGAGARESETSSFVFVSERGSPFTTAGFARMIERAAASAGLELKAQGGADALAVLAPI
jgi:site-specific recombinase XerD